MIAPVVQTLPADALQEWRRQIGRPKGRTPIRPFAVFSYFIRGKPRQWPLVELRHVTLVALFDEQLASGRLATRLVGVSGRLSTKGLKFGGLELCRFDKDLRLRPVPGGRGACFEPAQGRLLGLALQLDRYLERCAHYPYYPRRRTPRLPKLVSQTPGMSSTFVDFSGVRQRQVIVCTTPDQLHGQLEDLSYDFHTTRFRRDR